jgi:acyl-CoA reductase-like NAD-dependent aldehyde dehydrogenase
MGNAVVLKSDLNTAVSGGVIIARVFEEAGLPEGALQVLPGGSEAGAALAEDPNDRNRYDPCQRYDCDGKCRDPLEA